MAEGDFAAAEREARAAVDAESFSGRIGPKIVLAQTLQEQGRLEDALKVTQEAVDEVSRMEGQPKFSSLFFHHGDLLARLGRDAEAEKAFLREIQDFPSNPHPYTRLAVLYAAQGRLQEAVGLLKTHGRPQRHAARLCRGGPHAAHARRPAGRRGAPALRAAEHPESRELRAM